MRNKNKKISVILVLIIISLVSIYPFFFSDYVHHQDDLIFHRTRLENYYLTIRHLDFFPKVFSAMGNNYGYAADLFYPSVLLVPFALLRFLGLQFVQAFYLYQVIISFITASIAYYSFYSIKKSRQFSLLFACIYILSTYRLIDQSSRFALGEIWAFAFLPLFALGIYSILYTEKRRWGLTGISMSLMITSHFISSFLACILLGLFLLCNFRLLNKQIIFSLLKSAALALGLSAWIIFPVVEQTKVLSFNVSNTVLSSGSLKLTLGELIKDSISTVSIPYTEVNPNIGILLFAVFVTGLVLYRQLTPVSRKLLIISGLLFIASTNLFPWAIFKMSLFGVIQFPWRLLLFCSFFLSLLTVSLAEQLKFSTKKIASLMLITFMITLSFNVNLFEETIDDSFFKTTNENFGTYYSTELGHGREYLLTNTDSEKALNNPYPIFNGYPYINASYPIINNYNESEYTVIADSAGELILPKFFYKGYSVRVNGKAVQSYMKDGLLAIQLEEGKQVVKVTYEKTDIQRFSLGLSAVVWFAVCMIPLWKSKQKHLSVLL